MIEYSDDDNNSYKNDYDDDEYDPILYLIIFVEEVADTKASATAARICRRSGV